jgi:hypothetical protein
MNLDDEIKQRAIELEKDLLNLYGTLLITGVDLQKALGFPSVDAFRQAIVRRTLPVKVFNLPNRRGKFALIKDIAFWLANESMKKEVSD